MLLHVGQGERKMEENTSRNYILSKNVKARRLLNRSVPEPQKEGPKERYSSLVKQFMAHWLRPNSSIGSKCAL